MRLTFFLSFILLATLANAQKITENTIVKDSSGTIYPASIWRPLLVKGGHTLKPENKNDQNTAFYLVRLTGEEKEARMAKMPAPKESNFFRKGEKFNLGKLKDITGNEIDLKNNLGKITVVNYWFISCMPCRIEIPDLNNLVTKYASDSVRFVAIGLDDEESIKKFVKMLPFSYQLVDDGRYLADRNGVRGYPTHAIIDQEGKVYFHTTGLSTNTVYWLEKSIKELLNKKEPQLSAAK
ncbi:MAG TPA: TlpA disulfide reductase family protein [Flavisolibacter sp.]|nr:TlpA disulfide reductase family protein [Flavisolibacter sp.]